VTYYPRRVTVEDLIILNTSIIRRSGGTTGVRRKERLEYAVARPFMILGNRPRYPCQYDKAAAIMEIIIHDQPFVDGNKRTGLVAGASLLGILSGEAAFVHTAEGIRVAKAVERRELETTDLARWFKAVSR
jgi:death-on-curing protein